MSTGVDLSDCDKEPIHIPGAIQPHGALLAFKEPDLEIVQVSENIEAFIGAGATRVLGESLANVIDPSGVEQVCLALSHEANEELNPLVIRISAGTFNGLLHRQQGVAILELEPVSSTAVPGGHHPLRQALKAIQRAETMSELCRSVALEVRRITGFERAMVYRFDELGNGSVEAEARAEHLDPYLGLHYPASDIPQQARQLYLKNWLRLIPDARYTPAAIVPTIRPDTGEPLDLSYAALRSVSPIHLEYLRNMGVFASMSVSLIVNGQLWGLISCGHHSKSHFIPYELRSACEVIGRLVSLQLGALEERHAAVERAARRGTHQQLTRAMRGAGQRDGVLSALLTCPQEVMGLVDATGVAVIEDGEVHSLGQTPDPGCIRDVAQWLDAQRLAEPVAIASLSKVYRGALVVSDIASGLLTFGLPPSTERRILWFRPEVTRTIDWAGDPRKAVLPDPGQRLHPRRSFELWKQEVRHWARAWSAAEIEAAEELRRRAIEIDLERQVVRERQAVRARDDVVAVVSHDLKSPLGVIQTQAELLQSLLAKRAIDTRHIQKGAERIQRAVEGMNRLIHDLLDQAALEDGRLTLRRQPHEVGRLVEEALRFLRPLADGKQVRIATKLEEMAPIPIDRDRFSQVLANVIGNAIKFTPEGGLVTVQVGRADEAAEVSVQDDGPGIQEQNLPHIFDRYWQATETAPKGSGLGLYIAKGIVKAHGGRIWAESPPGCGAVIRFTLPLGLPPEPTSTGGGLHSPER